MSSPAPAHGTEHAALVMLTTEQFTQPVAGSYGSIRNTMVPGNFDILLYYARREANRRPRLEA